MGDIAFRLTDETLPSLKKSMTVDKQEKSELINEIKQFVELYQTYTITDYDYWKYENASIFSLFMDKFTSRSQELENRASELLLGVNKPGKSLKK